MLRIQRIYAYQPHSGEAGVFLDRLYPCSARTVSARRPQGTHGATGLAEGCDAERRTAPLVSIGQIGQGQRAPLRRLCRTLSGGAARRCATGRTCHPAPHPDTAAGYRAAHRRQTAAAIAHRRTDWGNGRKGELRRRLHGG